MTYDSTEDTKIHIAWVAYYMGEIVYDLNTKADYHDSTKLESPEKEVYDKYTPLLSAVEYGSDEYKQYLSEMGEALQHHYKHNRHHPEHFEYGIHDMNLIDLVEMICDWKAATLRVKNGDIRASIEKNRSRFGIEDQLYNILMNTVEDLDW